LSSHGVARILTPVLQGLYDPTGPFRESDHLFGGRGFALIKPSGGVRPIASPNAIVKLAARATMKAVCHKVSGILSPMQFGVGLPSGIDRIVQNVRLGLEQDDSAVLFQLDLKNAFNSISRDLILRALLEYNLPELIPVFLASYGKPKFITFRDLLGNSLCVPSESGVTQGDALGPLFFALGFHLVLSRVKRACPTVDIFAFLDDVALKGDLSSVMEAVTVFFSTLSELSTGLEINWSKSALFSLHVAPDNLSDSVDTWFLASADVSESALNEALAHGDSSHSVESQIYQFAKNCIVNQRRPDQQGILLLGCPISANPAFKRVQVGKVVERVADLCDSLHLLDSAQERLLLLRYCAVSRITHLLRCVDPVVMEQPARAFDDIIMKSFLVITQLSQLEPPGGDISGCVSETQIQQIHLPVRYGGFGITSAVQMRSLAFLSSVIDVIRLSPKDGEAIRRRWEEVLYRPQQCYSTEGYPTLIGSIVSCHADFLGLKNQYAEVTGSPQLMPRDTPTASPQTAPNAQRSPIPAICSTLADPSQWPQDSVSSLLDVKRPKFQSRATEIMAGVSFLSILQREDNVGKIRLRSQSGPMAGAWLSAIPSDQVFVIPDLALSISVRLRLGVPLGLLREGTHCLCSNTPHGQSPIADDVHLLKCTLGAGVVARHNNIRDTLAWLGKLAGALVTVEPHEYSSVMDGPNLRPDLLFRNISRPGSVVAVDVTVTHPVSSNSKTQQGAASRTGFLAARAERLKVKTYQQVCDARGDAFFPFVLEAFGLAGHRACDLVSMLAKTWKSTSDLELPNSTWSSHTFQLFAAQAISCALQNGNALVATMKAAHIANVLSGIYSGSPYADDKVVIGLNGPLESFFHCGSAPPLSHWLSSVSAKVRQNRFPFSFPLSACMGHAHKGGEIGSG
jgi:hypothetical protein